MSLPHEWIRGTVSMATWVEATALRAWRDSLYGNRFPESETDERINGDAAEISLRKALERMGVPHVWHRDNAAGNPDFTINGITVDVKCRKRAKEPETDYMMQVSAPHMDKADYYYMVGYDSSASRMIFLGAISNADMWAKSTRYEAGEQVHRNYTVPGTEAIYNVKIIELEAPAAWLRRIHP